MNTQDFERLKAVCEKEGFEIHLTDSNESQVSLIVQKKDIWEGVEFALLVSPVGNNMEVDKIYKLGLLNDTGRKIWIREQFLVPSTESAYIDQLKKEAFERFGEIKEGDRFDRINFSINLGTDEITSIRGGFSYYNKEDILYYKNLTIYKQGKWATKIPKKIEVEWCEVDGGDISFRVSRSVNYIEMPNLAKQLESYLNGEIE